MLEWALRYIRLGWPVIPLRGKIPLTEHGSKDGSLNESVVQAWWAKWPDANIGLATSHAFFAIDVDLKKGGQESWEMLCSQHGRPPDTIEQITGTGGRHILFLLPDFPVQNSESKIAPGIDVRGVGGYIVACPSIHPETKRAYDWDGIQEIEQQQLAAAPHWLIRLLLDAGRRKAPEKTPHQIAEGSRNDTLFRAGARLRRFGWESPEILASLKEINRLRCHPPLDEKELRTIAESAARYPPDTKANLFGQAVPKSPPETELPITLSDVEIAIDDVIARNDLLGAFRLAGDVAKLRTHEQALIKVKLRQHFGKEFLLREFDRSLKDQGVIRMPPPAGGSGASEGEGPDLLAYPMTDSGNGERIVALFGSEIRYCIEMQKWLVWDETRWMVDEKDAAGQLAKEMARTIYDQARLRTTLDRDDFEIWQKFARRSESHAGIVAALNRAASEPSIPISASELDQNAYLLNCLNGVVDLRTGQLLPHDRELLITKMCHVTYDQNAGCSRFLEFLHWAMGDNPEAEASEKTVRLVGFLQRAFGYALTADVSEKAVFVFWGPRGNNGKTTLVTTLKMILSEYATEIGIDTLMTTKTQDAAVRADLADLRGARFVTTSEVEKEHRLSEGKLKYITAGMGKIKSCRKYENPISFDATHKLFMDCNHRPQVRGTDDAIWRRLKAVPFEVSVDDSEIDKKLLEKLLAEKAGIVAWAVRGAQWWMRDGLGDPPELAEANKAWREHDDPLKEFLEDCCTIGPGLWVRSSELTAAYAWWCKKEHERFPLGREAFSERIRSKGFTSNRSRRTPSGKQLRTVEGLEVKDEISSQVMVEAGGGQNRFNAE